ncbi:hypothetical protein [Noviherbaspirillum sp.]|uniref:hypothetical protein n=1 Tax=Noviherbaspirillum sp. TaxID=1926288 RepID=UPI002D2C18C0|nr:hypothetical protein [Noviherbaspirillum sp.]HZW23281.1 hypothetical protein [Noviherbaspirillum sp.]
MNPVTMILGAAVFAFGLYTVILRRTAPHKLSRLQAMRDLFGDKTGDKVHLFAYAVTPLLCGAVFLFAGSRGVSVF